jgi:hypothetical protein
MTPEVNIPEIVAEVTAAFNRYEAALNVNDVAILDTLFWKSPHTLRYGIGEQLYGHDQIAAFRSGRDPAAVVRRDLLNLWVVTYRPAKPYLAAHRGRLAHRRRPCLLSGRADADAGTCLAGWYASCCLVLINS